MTDIELNGRPINDLVIHWLNSDNSYVLSVTLRIYDKDVDSVDIVENEMGISLIKHKNNKAFTRTVFPYTSISHYVIEYEKVPEYEKAGE